ncbi:MAG: FAD-binding oxidoreductase, partial [Saprospiraceae bacterium]
MKAQIITALIEQLGTEKVLTEAAVAERYCHIWRMDQSLNAIAVVLPRTTEELAAIMKICHQHGQAVVVHGGLTNLVGSTETQADELVISMEKMNQVEALDDKSRTITVQAGVILENIQNLAKEKALVFPLNFGAKGSAQIGGVISTNAGGLRVFRYGMTRNLVMGLEVVLADGTIMSSLKKIIKDNAAYDLKQLFIGSEGTLGIISKAVLKLVEAPRSRTSAFVGLNDYEKVIALLKFMDAGLAGTLSGFELIWHTTYSAMTSPPALAKPPLPQEFKYYVLLEALGSDQERDQETLQNLLEQA